MRAALGAGTGRLARQLLTESVVVAAAGAVVGVGLAAGAAARARAVRGALHAARVRDRARRTRCCCSRLACRCVVGICVGNAAADRRDARPREWASRPRRRRSGAWSTRSRGAHARRRAGGGVGRPARCRGLVGAQHDRAQSHRRGLQARAGAEPSLHAEPRAVSNACRTASPLGDRVVTRHARAARRHVGRAHGIRPVRRGRPHVARRCIDPGAAGRRRTRSRHRRRCRS